MKIRGLFVIPFAIAIILAPQVYAQHGNGTGRRYAAKLVSPRAGEVLTPGQQVTIKWEPTIPDVDLTWCEVEIYLSIDGGKSNVMRLTPQLDPGATYYNWTVPNLPTNAAVLDIHFGCETSFPESPSVQRQSTFVIGSAVGVEREVTIDPITLRQTSPGSNVSISWKNSVADVAFFELQVSYDRGAHFHHLATTKELQFLWNVPNDFSGHATFRVVAHTASGNEISSAVSADPQVIVRSSSN
jgi:hypothetical protein